ncbi:MAG: YfhO family protein, partial [Clostridiales bacterium]|nr:YfhO family protein [Clostridiales bacterium]
MVYQNDAPRIKEKKKRSLAAVLADNSFVMLAFFCSAVIMLLVFYCFDMTPFGDTTILRMDLYHQYGPLFAELYERIKSGGSMLYSWNTGLGGTFLGNYFNYLSSPLAFVIFFFGHKDIPDAIALMILLKASIASATFTYYIKKTFGRHDHAAAAFGVLYSFCGFFIAYYWNVMWIGAMALFPLVVLGLERIINERKPALYIVVLALTMISSYYMAMMVCIFMFIYFFIKYFSIDRDDATEGKLLERIKNSRFLRTAIVFGLASVAAAFLAAFALIPTYFVLKNCSATSDNWPADIKFYFSIF